MIVPMGRGMKIAVFAAAALAVAGLAVIVYGLLADHMAVLIGMVLGLAALEIAVIIGLKRVSPVVRARGKWFPHRLVFMPLAVVAALVPPLLYNGAMMSIWRSERSLMGIPSASATTAHRGGRCCPYRRPPATARSSSQGGRDRRQTRPPRRATRSPSMLL